MWCDGLLVRASVWLCVGLFVGSAVVLCGVVFFGRGAAATVLYIECSVLLCCVQ